MIPRDNEYLIYHCVRVCLEVVRRAGRWFKNLPVIACSMKTTDRHVSNSIPGIIANTALAHLCDTYGPMGGGGARRITYETRMSTTCMPVVQIGARGSDPLLPYAYAYGPYYRYVQSALGMYMPYTRTNAYECQCASICGGVN